MSTTKYLTPARLRGFLCAGLVAACLISPTASAALIKSYDFDSGFSDTLGNGVDLSSVGGTLSGGRYAFNFNEGLSLASALSSTTNYAIEFKFKMTIEPSIWSKLIDFENQGSDFGLYVGGNLLQFYGGSTGGLSPIPLNTDVVVTLTRNSATNEVTSYLNGVEQWSFIDTSNHAVSSVNQLHFFMDDLYTVPLVGNGGHETFAGSVDYIRIFDRPSTAVPEPASLALLGFGLAGLGFSRRRKQKAA